MISVFSFLLKLLPLFQHFRIWKWDAIYSLQCLHIRFAFPVCGGILKAKVTHETMLTSVSIAFNLRLKHPSQALGSQSCQASKVKNSSRGRVYMLSTLLGLWGLIEYMHSIHSRMLVVIFYQMYPPDPSRPTQTTALWPTAETLAQLT